MLVLWCDLSYVALASNHVLHAKTKHIELDFHFIREKILHQQLIVQHILEYWQVINIFTKALPSTTFHHLKLKVVPLPMILRGILMVYQLHINHVFEMFSLCKILVTREVQMDSQQV